MNKQKALNKAIEYARLSERSVPDPSFSSSRSNEEREANAATSLAYSALLPYLTYHKD